MNKHKCTPIDACKLEIQLLKAIEEDNKYRIEDAAKFRAAAQCKNYEEFRDIVRAAHLKPLEKHDSYKNSKTVLVSWNKTASRRSWKSNVEGKSNEPLNCFEPVAEEAWDAPITQRQFEEFWTCFNDIEKRVTLLQHVIKKDNFFGGKNISVDIIESIIKALLEFFNAKSTVPPTEKILFVVKIMKFISTSSRFSLNLQLLSNEGLKNIDNLLKILTELLKKSTDVALRTIALEDLTKKYNFKGGFE